MLWSWASHEKRKQQAAIPVAKSKLCTPGPEVLEGSGGTHQCRAYRNHHSAFQGGTFANSAPHESTAKAWLQSDLDEGKTLGGRTEVGGIW
jgi:hypothetical protein